MKSSIQIVSWNKIGEVDKRIYSGFIEHIGRAVYEGIYQPEHPSADEDGFRTDVMELVRDLNMPLMRYPGGNYVSSYCWEDGVGPLDQRKTRLDFAWKALEPNTFGLDQFVKWCRKANTDPIMAVNLGTRGMEDAMNLVEYCNFPGGTYWSDLRKKNGAEQTHNIKYWCLGNEVDGPWQAGHKTAEEYGTLACETAKLLKGIDKNAQFIVVGSSTPAMPTFPEWDRIVLEKTYGVADYISLHCYFANNRGTGEFLTAPEKISKQIETIISTCDYVKEKVRSSKTMYLCFDEWNVWFRSNGKAKSPEWTVARNILEDIYTMEDALVVGGLMMALLNHCDRVKIACIAQTVNVIAPIMTSKNGGAWKQTIYYPFYYTAKYGHGTVLDLHIDSPVYKAGEEEIPVLYQSIVWNQEKGELVFFLLNRDLKSELAVSVDTGDLVPGEVIEWISLHNEDLLAENTEDCERVSPIPMSGAEVSGSRVSGTLPPASWNMIRIALK